MPARLKKNFTSFEKKKKDNDSFLLFICLAANGISQAMDEKPYVSYLPHIFHFANNNAAGYFPAYW